MTGQDAVDLVLGKLEGVVTRGGYWMARCPAHEDREPSLSVKRGDDQPVVFNCHAGCERDAILDGLGLSLDDVSRPREERGEWTPRGEAVAIYDYTYERGELLFQVCRTAGKQFPQRRPDTSARSGWTWNLRGVPRVPYHLPQLIAGIKAGKIVWIVEGEKDVHAIEAQHVPNVVVTCNSGGAGKWAAAHTRYLRGAERVVVVADKDEGGRKHAKSVASAILQENRGNSRIEIVEAAQGKDASDHLAAGLSGGDFVMVDALDPTDYFHVPGASASPEAADPEPAEPWSELGYARRLISVYGRQLRYVPAWRRWLVWDGKRWAHNTTGQSARWMKAIARRVTADAMAIPDERECRAAVNLARRGESAAGIAGALTLAGTEAGIVVTPDDLDADPFLLNCANGVLDLRTGVLGPHEPELLLTRMTGAPYRPGAIGAEFAKFLDRVQPAAEMQAYLARNAGHGLDGTQVEHVLPIHFGPGANGKSTFVRAVLAALGDYAAPADPELLTARTFDAHPTGTADLCGLRLAVLHESDHGRRLAEGTIKRLTGGDRLKARRMREDFWWFDPSHTFLMLTNHKPIISGTDEGIWCRIKLVPWEVVIPPGERDLGLDDRLALELDAVLAWLVSGYQDWHEHGLADPDAMTKATMPTGPSPTCWPGSSATAAMSAMARSAPRSCSRPGSNGARPRARKPARRLPLRRRCRTRAWTTTRRTAAAAGAGLAWLLRMKAVSGEASRGL